MALELDHFFILVEPGGAVADALLTMGFNEAPGNRHKGQGTANRRFVFSNSKLELLWVEDGLEALQGPGRELYLCERTKSDAASPFGFIFRAKAGCEAEQPFDGWRYQPDFFKPPMAFLVGRNSNILAEPCCIYAPFFKSASGEPEIENRPQVAHFNRVSNISVTVVFDEETSDKEIFDKLESADTGHKYSGVLNRVSQTEGLTIKKGRHHLMELTFNNHGSGQSRDLRPLLPLIIYW